MKKTTISKIFIITLILVMMTSILVACDFNSRKDPGGDPTPDVHVHTHTFSQAWENDSTYHWHKATCEHSTEVSGKEKHKFGNGVLNSAGTEKTFTCTVCQYSKTEVVQQVKATVKQSKVNLSTFKVNIPAGTKYLGITTKTGAVAAADSDSPKVRQYLSAFSDFDELINKEITFSQVRKVFLTHVMIDTYTERVEIVTTEEPIYEMVEDPNNPGQLIEKLDENGQPIQAKDENGNLLFKTEEVIHKEKLGTEYKKLFSYRVDGVQSYAIHETTDGNVKYYAADETGKAILVNEERQEVTLPEENDWNYVYELDASGKEIPRQERNADNIEDYVYADTIPEDELDEKEKIVEVTIVKSQDTFALDIIKLKVVNNFAFICFAIPIPDECYLGGVYTIEEADGTITRFTAADLPERKTEANAAKYDSVDYYTNRFVQSYILDTNTGKIYALGDNNLDEVDEFGMALMGDKKYEIRLDDEDKINLTLRDISSNIVDGKGNSALAVYKDKNGIIFVKESIDRRTRTDVVHYSNINVTFVYYSLEFNPGRKAWKTPTFVFDYNNNAYSFIDGKMKKVTGYEKVTVLNENNEPVSETRLTYSEEDYSQTSSRIRLRPLMDGITDKGIDLIIDMFVLNGKLFILNTVDHTGCGVERNYSYLISKVSNIESGKKITGSLVFNNPESDMTISSVIMYTLNGTDYCDRSRNLYSYLYNDGIIFVNTNNGELRILYFKAEEFLTEAEKSEWSVPGTEFSSYYPSFSNGVYYKELVLTYNDVAFTVNDGKTIQSIEKPVVNSDNTILFELNGNRTETFIGIYYFVLDLEAPLPSTIKCYSNKDDATIKRPPKKDTSYIISIAPIN